MNKLVLLKRISSQLTSNRSEFLRGVMRLTQELWSKQQVQKNYKLGKGIPTVDLLELFPDFDETIHSYSYLDGTSKAIDISFIKAVVKSKPGCSYIEFGSWRGESLVNICDSAGSCYSLTLSQKEMKDFGFGKEVLEASSFFVKDNDRVTKLEHNSQTFDFTDFIGKFDVVFVDADHEYPGVKIDTANARKLLKDDTSMIIWHDYGRTYETINWQVFHGILDGIPGDEHQYLYKVSNTLCAIYTRQPVTGSYPQQSLPDKTFTVNIKAHKLA